MRETIDFHLRADEEFIPLMSLLKAVNVVYSGAEAGDLITQGLVLRDGLPELRKRAKIHSGETIIFDKIEIKVY